MQGTAMGRIGWEEEGRQPSSCSVKASGSMEEGRVLMGSSLILPISQSELLS